VSLALNLKDGYRNTPLSSGSAVRVRMDGEWYLPIYKEGGWFVFTDLPAGEHRIELINYMFIPEQLSVTIPPEQKGYLEIHCSLQPSPSYPFPPNTTKIRGKLRANGGVLPDAELLIVSMLDRDMLKVAEDDAAAGKREIKLFSTSKRVLMNIPGVFFIVDGKNSELCSVTDAQEGLFTLAEPLVYPHKRGVALRAVRRFKSDGEGAFFAALDDFSQELTAYVRTGQGYLEKKISIKPGELNEMDIVF